MTAFTRDEPAPGVVIYQPRRGFRYGAEAYWLAGFALERPVRRAVDLGTGSGIVAALLATQGVAASGVELRPEWLSLWSRSWEESEVKTDLFMGDVRTLPPERWDLAVSNPPFFRAGSGPPSPDVWKAAARTESSASLADFLESGRRAVGAEGRVAVVIPRDREDDARVAAGAPTRRVEVGRVRVLLEWGPGEPENGAIAEDDARVRGWYARLRPLAPGAANP